ncbi:hypothetical protein BH18ACI5_BH18ACI5_26110 [soil metagenome]
MKRSIAAWTVTAAAAAILGLPPASAAQSAAQPPATAQSAQPPASAAGENAVAQAQLRRARAALDDVTTETLSVRGKTQVAELKRRLTALERNSKATNKTWGTEVAALDKIIVTLLASDATPAGTSGTTAPPSAKPTTSTNLDDASREKLTEARAALTAYAAAMSGQSAPASAAPSAAPSTSSATATPAEPSATPAQPPTTPAQSTATPPASTAPAQPPSAESAQAQPDEQAARKYLTEARTTLSEMTQLPAAAQLSGDARTQISQLISNFNELITTQTEWRASYAKVNANLTALIGPDNGTPDPSSASGTAGAVGTSGTTAPNLDPAVRGKLVELRKHLSEFERVASGGTASASATPSATSGETGTSGTTPSASSSTTPSASSSTTTPSASSSTTTPSASSSTTTPSASGSTTTDPAASAAAPHAESMRLIAAIESMLKSQNEGGGLTLDKTQADMLRTHLTDLKRLLEHAKK